MSFYSKFARYYEQLFPFRVEVYHFLKGYAGSTANSVLDVGCGPGHYCGHFAREGFRAIGIDLDDSMFAEAAKHYHEAQFHCLDMRLADKAGSGFGCAWSIGNVLAHLPQNELASFIGKIHEMLLPGGIWIMQVMNWDNLVTLKEYEFPVKTITVEGTEATFHRHYSSISPSSLRFTLALRQADTVLFEETVPLYPATLAHYLTLHESAGFRCEGTFSDFSGKPLKNEPGTGFVLVFGKRVINKPH